MLKRILTWSAVLAFVLTFALPVDMALAQAKNPCNPEAQKVKNPCSPEAQKVKNPCSPEAQKVKNPCSPEAQKVKNPCHPGALPANPGAQQKQ